MSSGESIHSPCSFCQFSLLLPDDLLIALVLFSYRYPVMRVPKFPPPARFPILLLIVMLMRSFPLVAQDLPEPAVSRFEISPLISYRSHLSLPVQAGIEGLNSKVVLDSSPAFGIGLGLRIDNSNLLEFTWSRQDSYARIENSSSVFPSTRAILNQIHCNFSQEYGLGHRVPWLRPFLVGSVGATSFGITSSSSTHLSVGVGGGVRFLVSHHLGFRVRAEWLPIFHSAEQAELCGGTCLVTVGGTVASQSDISVGPVFRF